MSSRRKKPGLLKAMRKLPVFWKTLVMMLFLVLLSIISLVINSVISERVLTKNYLQQAQISLEQHCESMASELYATYAIPKAIESVQYYSYIATITDGILPDEYVSVLPLIRNALNNQLYLFGQSEECLLYFSKSNCITTRFRSYQYAEDCFERYIQFSETTQQEIMELLEKRGLLTMLPVQDVSIGNRVKRCLPLVVSPPDAAITVVTFYSEDTICSFMGIEDLPEGTYMQIRDYTGNLLMAYPQEPTGELERNGYTISAEDSTLHFTVSLLIPKSYFQDQLSTTRLAHILCVIVTIILGTCFSITLSKNSSRPLQELIASNEGIAANSWKKGTNEVSYIATVLKDRRKETSDLQSMLMSSLLIRAFSGAILSSEEEAQLTMHLKSLSWPCRLALVHAQEPVEPFLGRMEALPARWFLYQPVSAYEIGILLEDGEEQLRLLDTLIQELTSEFTLFHPVCGVSSRIDSVEEIHLAVRQARLAIPQNPGVGVYSGMVLKKSSFTWLNHERLYQYILAGDEEAVIALLRKIAAEPNRGLTAREVFFCVCFVLHSATEELGIDLPELDAVEYDGRRLFSQNILQMEPAVDMLMDRIRDKQEQTLPVNDIRRQLAEYLQNNFSNYELSAASLAQQFNCSEKWIYTQVREITGQTLSEYLLTLRMRHAAILLCSTNMDLDEIAHSCGYEVRSTFYRAFKKYYDTSPAQYRKCTETENTSSDPT